jgi:hypothetical protein
MLPDAPWRLGNRNSTARRAKPGSSNSRDVDNSSRSRASVEGPIIGENLLHGTLGADRPAPSNLHGRPTAALATTRPCGWHNRRPLGRSVRTVGSWHFVASHDECGKRSNSANLHDVADDLIGDSGTWRVFISYSWDSAEHKAWVLAFANRLRDDGVDAVLDQTHLDFGGRTPEFMERSVRDSRIVLVICTEGYKQRFDGRKGGAGYEGHIITAAILNSAGVNKFIPILRQGDWTTAMPTALDGAYGADLRSDSIEVYQTLVRHLHGVNRIRPLGRPPAC